MRKEIKIGIYAVVILLASWAGIRFLSGVDVFGRSAVYTSYYEDADGLKEASPVMIRGVKVGQILKLEVDPEQTSRVKASYVIPKSYRLPEDTRARIFSNGLLGGKAISIDLGTSDVMLSNGDVIQSEGDTGFLSEMGSSMTDLKAKVDELMEKLGKTLDGVNSIIDRNDDNIAKTIAHLESVIEKIDSSSIVGDLGTFSSTLKDQSSSLAQIVGDVRSFTEPLAKSSATSALTQSLENLKNVLEGMANGEGTAGKLMKDEQLYRSVTEASSNLSALLEDLKANPKKYINVRVFGGKTWEERKADRDAKAAYKAQKKEEKKNAKGQQ